MPARQSAAFQFGLDSGDERSGDQLATTPNAPNEEVARRPSRFRMWHSLQSLIHVWAHESLLAARCAKKGPVPKMSY